MVYAANTADIKYWHVGCGLWDVGCRLSAPVDGAVRNEAQSTGSYVLMEFSAGVDVQFLGRTREL